MSDTTVEKLKRGENSCGFCAANDWEDSRNYSAREFVRVRHTSNGYQSYVFVICDQCAPELTAALSEAFR